MVTFLEIQEQFKEFDLCYRFYDTEQEALKFLLQTFTLVWSTNIMASDKVFVLGRSFVHIRNKCLWLCSHLMIFEEFQQKGHLQSILQEEATGSAG